MTKINIASLSSFVRKRVLIWPGSLLWSIFLQIFIYRLYAEEYHKEEETAEKKSCLRSETGKASDCVKEL